MRRVLVPVVTAALVLVSWVVAPTAATAATCNGQLATIDESAGVGGIITGTAGDDVIVGSAFADLIDAGGGSDTVCAGAGIDHVAGGAGNDVIDGQGGSDLLEGGDGNDTLIGGEGDDSMLGGADDDNLYGHLLGFSGTGDDTLDGGTGDDFLSPSYGDDVVAGGGGTNRLAYDNLAAGVWVSLQAGGAQATGAGSQTITDVQNVRGTDHDDVLIGDAASNDLDGAGGDDVLDGGSAGSDVFRGGAGVDIAGLNGRAGGVTASLGVSTPQVLGTGLGSARFDGIEGITGTDHADVLTGSSGNDLLSGLAGDDLVSGGDGFDVIEGGPGNDTLDGGPGYDELSYATAPAGVRVSLAIAAPQQTGGAGTDTITGFNYLLGSPFADDLGGVAGVENRIRGGAGDDRITGIGTIDLLVGEAGNDVIEPGPGSTSALGGPGTDSLSFDRSARGVRFDLASGLAQSVGSGSVAEVDIENLIGSPFADVLSGDAGPNLVRGGSGADRLDGQGGNDIVRGEGGDDTVVPGAGDDVLDGGPGSDLVSFAALDRPVQVSLGTRLRQALGAGGADVLLDFERAVGTRFGDVLTGSSKADVLRGGGGADRLRGRSGRDRLVGGRGKDRLLGGAGRDICAGGQGRDRGRSCEVRRSVP